MDTLGKIKNAIFGNQKTNNAVRNPSGVSGNDFFKHGNRNKVMGDDWSSIKMSDVEYYTDYSYAAINNRANKTAQIGTEYLRTKASKDLIETLTDRDQEIVHPYIELINNSDEFTPTQFWYDISTYIDLEGVYYLMAVRNVSPSIIGSVQRFELLNPYEIQRVVNRDTLEVGGYIENRGGMMREIPKEMIIEIRKLNPFSREKSFAMTDAARESQYALKQANDYTRSSLRNNLSAPGIIATDVVLEPENFINFQSRVMAQEKGAPIFANGASAVTWQPMNIDMDKAALSEINEINRSTVFAVSGVSKTTMGIEESGTTRETARVQRDKFIEDHIMPQVQMIIGALNQDYKRYYKKEYEENKFSIYIDNPLAVDKDSVIKGLEVKENEFSQVSNLVKLGYEYDIASRYILGEITLADLGEPTLEPELSPEEILTIAESELLAENSITNTKIPIPPKGGSNTLNSLRTKKFVPKGTNSRNIEIKKYELKKEKQQQYAKALQEADKKTKQKTEVYLSSVFCNSTSENAEIIKAVNALGEDSKNAVGSYESSLLNGVQNFQAKFVAQSLNNIENDSDFSKETDIISKSERIAAINELQSLFTIYYLSVFPVYANYLMNKRTNEFGSQVVFTLDDDVKEYIKVTATNAAESHVDTLIKDLLNSARNVYEETLSELRESLKAKRIYDSEEIFEETRRMALEGAARGRVISALTDKYEKVSKTRAKTIARTESNRAFSQSQFQADIQFLKAMNLMDSAYKKWITTSDNPCEYCIELSTRGPIPFDTNFQDLGTEISYDYVKRNGDVTKRVLKIDYEPLNAGNAHVNCGCRYKLVIKDQYGNFIENNINDVIKNSSVYDYKEELKDIVPEETGYIMLDTEHIKVTGVIEDFDKYLLDDIEYGNLPAENTPHVTILDGVLRSPSDIKRAAMAIFSNHDIKSVKISEFDYFDNDNGFVVVAKLEKSDELIKLHEDMTLLPHASKFSEYNPHISIMYINSDADVDKIVTSLNKEYKGEEVKVLGLNLGNNDAKIENKGNPYRDTKTGQYTDAPFSKTMVEKGSNRKSIDEAKTELKSSKTSDSKKEKTITDEQLDAIDNYSVEGNLYINSSLRENKGLDNVDEYTVSDVKNIDAAMIDNAPNQEYVYRGTYAKLSELKVGSSFIDYGFTSTSKDPNIAVLYSDPYGSQASEDDNFGQKGYASYVFKIKSSSIKKGIDIEKRGTLSNKEEREFLLPRGSKYKVVSIKDNIRAGKLATVEDYGYSEVVLEIVNE